MKIKMIETIISSMGVLALLCIMSFAIGSGLGYLFAMPLKEFILVVSLCAVMFGFFIGITWCVYYFLKHGLDEIKEKI